MNLKIKRDFSERKQDLDDPQFVLTLIEENAEMIAENFKSWDKSERRCFKQHFNELIKGVYTIGNKLVGDPSTFRSELAEIPAMQNPENL